MILDCPFLAHRAAAAMGGLHHGGEPTSVMFGLMRDLVGWQELFRTNKAVFCFDRGRNKRLDIYPEYKRNRHPKEKTEEGKLHRKMLQEQIGRLMDEDLFRLGYRNVFWEDGYEADDVIASIVLSGLPEGDEAVIVSSDADLYQLIGPRVSMFVPRTNKRRTLQWFYATHGIDPGQWADVKAIAGCSGDNVVGVRGVGEQSAVAFLAGRMKPGQGRHAAIMGNNELWRRNLKLVQLPFEGCPTFELRKDCVTKERWREVCEAHGMKSLRELCPGGG